MAKEIAGQIKLQIKGGAANPSPPVGPALGSKGINIMEFCKQFNARTQDKAGKVLPVVITYYADKTFDFVVKTPPVAVQLLEASKQKSGSAQPNRKKVAQVTWDTVKAIAEDKLVDRRYSAKHGDYGHWNIPGNEPLKVDWKMSKVTKNRKLAAGKLEEGKMYTLQEASALVKEITTTKFDASVDVDVRLGVDPRKSNQMVRGVVSLPHGTGKETRVLVLCTPDKEAEAKAAGADYVGLDEYIEKIKGGWTDIDIIITMPAIMGKIGALGRVLGPRGLMPNPKSGTVTNEIGNAVKEVKQGKIDFKVDKAGIVHSSVGKVSFSPEQII